MKHVKVLGAALVLMAASACATAPHPAHAQPAHPAYLHALSDLRMARALLDRPAEYNVVRDQFAAIDHVNGAIGEIRHASYDDGRDPNWNPPIDTNINHRGRLTKALDLIATAEHDLRSEEDNPYAAGWRNAAFHHLEEARHAVEHAINDKRIDEDRY
ncbi:hypothetical protein FBZ89_102347 [Nitrospirillum amazonense]|uniref:Uncharacterized protein n=1 Tax=Nitrospirillum amazonense TaxID=28077 RepID=A0A560FPY3_9PROT|nr:hypothetical protein [Nitrospirillum amazonense]TWB23590.1 hypothetical protein FBZ89_102347 [Nitrospirillum amazonense]